MKAGPKYARAQLIISCEHATNQIPPQWAALFQGKEDLLQSHRGWDPGALGLARRFADFFDAPLLDAKVSRLLVETNRTIGHPRVFSEITRPLSEARRNQLLEEFYAPHRDAVVNAVKKAIQDKRTAIHLGIHTFAPVLNGEARRTQIGILYDPQRLLERNFSRDWQERLRRRLTESIIHCNQPYRGSADGLTTAMRKRYGPNKYLGIELEVNQGLLDSRLEFDGRLIEALALSLKEAHDEFFEEGAS